MICAVQILDNCWNREYFEEGVPQHGMLIEKILSFEEKKKLYRIFDNVEKVVNCGKPFDQKVLAIFRESLQRKEKRSVNPYYFYVILASIKELGIYDRISKYTEYNDFCATYRPVVDCESVSPIEKQELMEIANWMNIANMIIEPKWNKIIMLRAITKLVEGPSVLYITGTGQTPATSRRVKIYESECNIVPLKRNRTKAAEDDRVQQETSSKVKKSTKRKILAADDCTYETFQMKSLPKSRGSVVRLFTPPEKSNTRRKLDVSPPVTMPYYQTITSMSPIQREITECDDNFDCFGGDGDYGDNCNLSQEPIQFVNQEIYPSNNDLGELDSVEFDELLDCLDFFLS